METPLFQQEDLYQLIPQRPPIVMVDTLWYATDTTARTSLTIQPDNLFVSGGVMREPGLIEHIAQSVASFKGYETFRRQLPPQLGYIGEIKKCRIHLLPKVGSQLSTQVEVLAEAMGITLVAAQTYCTDTLVAECQMKLFIKRE